MRGGVSGRVNRQAPGPRPLIAATVILLFVSAGFALDVPHDGPPGPSDCSDCHDTHGAAGFFLINQQFVQDLCASCHDGVTATDVQTHLNPTKGPWQGRDYDANGQDIVCIDCHDPHTQRSALGQNFVGFLGSGGTNILRQTPGGPRTILYDSTGARGSYIKNNPDNGTCEVCHSVTTTFTFGDDTDTHFGSGSGQACIACHDHADGFAPSGGTCTECHNQAQGTRRQITDDPSVPSFGEFGSAFTSHHVNDGTATEIVTKWDCVVCHAEGNVLTGEPDDNFHQKDGVQLKDVDTGAALADWSGLTASARTDFCLSCHDGDGATGVTGRTDPDPDATTNALNPFNDGLTNAHEPDGFDGTPAPHARPRVIDVAAQFDPLNTSHHAVLGAAYGSAAPFGSSVDSAIQGVRTDLAWDSTLDCEDCHYGGATTNLSGHGTANARYMLRDLNGNDTLATGGNINCYRCHNPSDAVSVYGEHDKGQHIDDSINLFGISCLNCHGGGTEGGIHGVDAPVTDDDGGGSYNPNVFTYGSGLDLISNWANWAKNGVSCSSLNSSTRLNSCTHHGGSTNWDRIGTSPTRTYRNP
jgi:predicted CXXCH cytochrome family protein